MPHLYDALESLSNVQQETVDTLKGITAVNQKIMSAFPSGDVDGHKRYHETMIEDMQSRKDLTKAIKEKTISGLIWAGMVAAGAAGWHELKMKLVGE